MTQLHQHTIADDGPSYTTAEAAAYLKARGVRTVLPSTLKAWRIKRRGPAFYMIAGRAMYCAADLDAYVASCRVDPAKPLDRAPPSAAER
jgi:hypothetical protein